MVIRRLNPSEHEMLKGIADGIVPPAHSAVVVAEQEGQIIGRMIILPIAHLEGTWVAEAARGGSVAARLFAGIQQEMAVEGLTALMAYSTSGEHDAYLHRLGFERMPCTVWRKEIKCR